MPRGRGRYYYWAEDIIDRLVRVIQQWRARGYLRADEDEGREFVALMAMLAESPTWSGTRHGSRNNCGCDVTGRLQSLVAGLINRALRPQTPRPIFE